MSIDLDPEIVDDFNKQIDEQLEIVSSINETLKSNLTQSELFVQVGQVADRVYGAIAMFGFKEFSEYCLKMKEMSYKCSKSDPEHEELRTKCFEIIREFPQFLKTLKEILVTSDDTQEISRKYHLDTKRIEKILSSYLHNITEGSIAYEDVRTYYYVYDKLGTILTAYKAENREFDPAPKFFNALAGFKKGMGKNPEEIAGIILETQSDSWEALIKEIKLILPNVPIALSIKNKRGIEGIEKEKLGVDCVISSLSKYSKVIEAFNNIVKRPPLTAPAIKDQDKELSADDVVSVSPTIFKNGSPSLFDIYVKINDQKFIKVISANQPFDTDLIEKHIKRQISKYYIFKSDYQKYCQDYETELNRISNDPTIGFAKKKQSVLDHADHINYFIEENGVDQRTIESARKFVEQSEKLIHETVQDRPELKAFLDDVTNMEHGSALCLMSGLFLDKIKAKKDLYNDVALLCFFHDIGKRQCSENVRSLTPVLLSKEELIEYYSHPKFGAQILAELNFKPALLEAVSQHHIRRDNSGFPKLNKDTFFNPIAELIGMCEEFITTIEECERNELKPVPVFKNKIKNKFSQKFQDVFNLTFK